MKPIVLAIVVLVSFSYSATFAEEKPNIAMLNSQKNVSAYEVLRAIEDLHHILAVSNDLAKYKVIYDGGLSKDSRTSGVWPKGRIGCWRVLNLDGRIIANLQLLKKEEKDVQGSLGVIVNGIKMRFSVEAYGKDKDLLLADFRRIFGGANAQIIRRVDDVADDEDIRKIGGQKQER